MTQVTENLLINFGLPQESSEGPLLNKRAHRIEGTGMTAVAQTLAPLLRNRIQNIFFELREFGLRNLLGREVSEALQNEQNTP